MVKWKEHRKRKVAFLLVVLMFNMVVLPYLPLNIMETWGFKINIESSYNPSGPYITGQIEGENRPTELLCLNKGAPANSSMDYQKVTSDVNYSEGTLEQKKLFWAYIGAFGSADGNDSFERYDYSPRITPGEARRVAWKTGENAWVNMMANDGFMNLQNVPEGCKAPEEIFDITSKYDTPEKAMSINAIRSEPGVFSKEKLYQMMGLSGLEALEKYCSFQYIVPDGYTVVKTETATTLHFNVARTDGALIAIGEAPGFTIKVIYDPAYFKVVKVTGRIEKYTAVSGDRADEAQVLMRAIGKVEEVSPEFYMTTGAGFTPTPGTGVGDSGSGGGNRGDSGGISYRIYEHKETFESNYKVDLTKYDYETGLPLKDSTWQVLESFPDQTKLADTEAGGSLMEKNMREEPTTWPDWLVFEDDMVTDENGYISHADQRFYDFDHAYCNGHPIPPEPEGGDDEEEGDDDEYEQLMEEWQEKVDECEAKAAACNGTLHHWMCGSESEPSESEAFTASGCKTVRDTAYDNFINLRYSYTFRETDARDGYIIHGQNGHPDDVPIEIITTAASEAGQDCEWTQAGNEDIRVSGYLRNWKGGKGDGEDDSDNDVDTASLEADGFLMSHSLKALEASGVSDNVTKMYLTEHYDLPLGERTVNALRSFFGLPEAFVSENTICVNIVAEDDIPLATGSDAELEEGEEPLEIPLINDIVPKPVPSDKATGSDASISRHRVSGVRSHFKKMDTPASSSNIINSNTNNPNGTSPDTTSPSTTSSNTTATGIPQAYQYSARRVSRTTIYGADDEPGLIGYGMKASEIFAAGDNFGDTVLDSQPGATSGPSDGIAHSWAVYDHRVPGQIHFNKRDMALQAGETDAYDSYGDTQGDATLEGAVYGLFAADDIYGPDTQRAEDGSVEKGTGIIFDANDLVAVAATDKNGDGSFLTITERPHSTYNYKTGQIEYSGKAYPGNLYDEDTYRKANPNEETGRIYRDCLGVNGDYWIGRPLILGNYYIKELSRSEGFELSVTGKDMAVTNAADENRADYGQTEEALSHPAGSAWVSRQLKHLVTFPEKFDEFGRRENLFEFAIGSRAAVKGYDVAIDGIPEGADVYFNDVEISTVKKQVVIGHEWVDASEEPLYETAKDAATYKKDASGNRMKNPAAAAGIPRAAYVYAHTADKLDPDKTASAADLVRYQSAFTEDEANVQYMKCELEGMMRQLGMETPRDLSGRYSTESVPVYDEAAAGSYGNPEITIRISNVTTNASIIRAVLDYYQAQKVFTYGGLQDITLSGDTAAVRLAVSMTPNKLCMVETDDSGTPVAGYLFRLNEATNRYIFRKYTGDNFMAMAQLPGSRWEVQMSPDYQVNNAGLPEDIMDYASELDEYLHYEAGDVLYEYWSADGSTGYNPVRRKVYQAVTEEQEVQETATSSSQVPEVASREEAADPEGSTYVYYDKVSGQYILHVGTKDADLSGERTCWFTVAIPDGSTTVTDEDIAKIGINNVWGIKAGDRLNNSAYIMRIAGAGVGVTTGTMFDKDKSFIKNQSLIYNGSHNLCEDGNTKESPNPIQERIVSQQIKVTKTIDTKSYNNTSSYAEVHEDWWTRLFGGAAGSSGTDRRAAKLDNFRFKTYLKSNLERLYRDEDGNVTWLDRKGNEIDILEANRAFPERVSKIYTKVLHKTDSLYQDSADAILANTELYSYEDGFIREDQNTGYTSVLETVERLAEDDAGTRMMKSCNYDKFFDAIAVANNDKWDDAAPTYTSWQPVGNAANRTSETTENARVSDKVRQFAIDWYLDDEVAKLVRAVPSNPEETEDKDGTVSYTDEMYDEALRSAVIKAENYLKPFFACDLDEIYAISWDSETDGGSDRDATTLSADTLSGDTDIRGDGYYFGTSRYLPYGDYVVVEQQPRYAALGDFKNKHYETDRPREVTLPAVYADYAGSQASPEVFNSYYNYDAATTQSELERKYKIRFNEEALHLIKGRNAEGDFEVYKYGLTMDNIKNGASASPATGEYFALTQSEYRPYKNYYNSQDDRTSGNVPYYLSEGLGGREKVSGYYRYSSVAEKSGTADDVPYPGGIATEDNIPGIQYRDNVQTMHGVHAAYNGKYAAMLVPWSITASENSAAEVPDSEPADTGESSCRGFAYGKFRNRLYTAKLRIEKLDSETHENILHDGALFHIYAASRDDSQNGEGTIQFFHKDTVITGTKEFLESMGASHIQPIVRRLSWIDKLTGKEYGPGNLYSGTVPAGNPICEESEQIVLGDSHGLQTVAFKSYSTVLDGEMKKEEDNTALAWQLQTVGYLETPQPLSAGCYVICEAKAPSGYARTKPIALEIYSDKVAYYKEGNRDARVLAALYEYESDNQTANSTKPQDRVHVARIHAENQPIKLQVEKVKESSEDSANTTADKTVTYKINGRIDGKLSEIGNNPDYIYACKNGEYLGYAWRKGTLEYLNARKAAGDEVEIIYDGSTFAGYGYATRTLETADDASQYVTGAVMTLFDALALTPTGDTEDFAYEGLVIERTDTNNISRMYVKQGYAGSRTEFRKETDENGQEYTTDYQAGTDEDGNPISAHGGIWSALTVERPDTDILYYALDNLEVTFTEQADGREIRYGYDRNHNKIPLEQLEDDKANIDRTDTEHSIFAFRGSTPYLELTGGDFTRIEYSLNDKILTVGEDTRIYHLDRDGNRDALVDSHTGMAYVTETDAEGNETVLVWSVVIHRDEYGNVIARDKITTSRIATIGENQDGYYENVTLDIVNHSENDIPAEERPSYRHTESGYITGSWNHNPESPESPESQQSHQETTVNQNRGGQNMNNEVLMDGNNGSFQKEMNPVYDSHGLAKYYQQSEETYDKDTEFYDRNGDFVRQQDSDNLEEYNGAAYRIHKREELFDGIDGIKDIEQPELEIAQENRPRQGLYHRLGESYILENTWVTSDKTPNDPFQTRITEGQPDLLKRLPKGHYIMEEIRTPKGYLKGMPTGITVKEIPSLQQVKMVDKTTKQIFEKVDGAETYTRNVLDMNQRDSSGRPVPIETVTEAVGAYGFDSLPDAEIALYHAEQVFTNDSGTRSEGEDYCLRRKSTDPVTYASTDSRTGNQENLTARWTTGDAPVYLEGLPEGCYVLEELVTPSGFVTSEPLAVEIANTPEVQIFTMYDDHTKVEFEKYCMEAAEKKLLVGAGFTLYEARTDAAGNVIWTDGKPQYHESRAVDTWVSGDRAEYADFIPAFEEMYRQYGTQSGTSVVWEANGSRRTASFVSAEQMDPTVSGGTSTRYPTSARLIFRTDTRKDIRITVYGETASQSGRDFTFEYQFDYRKLPDVNGYANSYQTVEGRRRLDYLPAGGSYVLVETDVPPGYAKAEDVLVTVMNTADVQRYHVENTMGQLIISKTAAAHYDSTEHGGELAGAHLALYRADSTGAFVQNPEYLVTDWTTGEDGTYTELDAVNNRIPEGYAPGDLKPHTIRWLADGTYWLAELKSPAYYTTFEPVRIEYRTEEKIRIVRVSDVPVTGELEVKKTDSEGNLLPGAVFALTAYRKSDLRTPILTKVLSGTSGILHMAELPVGEVQPDGSIIPYLYRLREQVPPDGYAVNTQIFRWQFAPDKNGVSFVLNETAQETIIVPDEKTRIIIEKKDFNALADDNSAGAFVAGAQLAVYEITGRDDGDRLIYDESNPAAVWTTLEGENGHVLEGLKAGRSYLLKEQKAPPGYSLMKPVVFTLSADGRKIAAVSNRLNTVTVNYIDSADISCQTGKDSTDRDSTDAIHSLTLRGRYAIKTIRELVEPYTVEEKTIYSDGTELLTGRFTAVPHQEDREATGRQVSDVELSIEFADGTPIASYHPSEILPEKEIPNNVSPENPIIRMHNAGKPAGSALDASQPIINTIYYVNLSNKPADMELNVSLDGETILLDWEEHLAENSNVSEVSVSDSRLHFRMNEVKPLQGGAVTFTTEAGGESSVVTAELSCNGKSIRTAKEVPVLLPGRLTIFNELTGSGKTIHADETEEFEVRLYTEAGEELRGSYAYSGSGGEGMLRSGDHVELAGNQFISVDPAPYKKIRFQVTRIGSAADIGSGTSWITGEPVIAPAHGACVTYTRSCRDTSEREIFKKGESYVVREMTTFTDGTVLETNRLAFTLDGRGAVQQITAFDKKTDVTLSKIDITSGEELPGCRMSLLDEELNPVDSWISGTEPHRLKGVLEAGKTYVLREEYPAEGYARAAEIRFKVNEEGVPEMVVMADDITRIQIVKLDCDTKKPLAGAEFQILDEEGTVLDTWISGQEPHCLSGILNAGADYVLREIQAPRGYIPMEDMAFTVPETADVLTVTCENHRRPHVPGSEEPEHPSPPVPETIVPPKPWKIGFVTASYTPKGMKAGGRVVFGEDGRITIPLPGTGDVSGPAVFSWLMVLSFLGVCILKRKQKK